MKDIEPLKIDNLSVFLEKTDRGLYLRFVGDIDMRDTTIEFLPYLINIHEALHESAVKEITADFTRLSYVNSNGIKSIINWIMKMDELPDEKKYRILIIANNEIAWQESSLPVLQKLFPDYLSIIKP